MKLSALNTSLCWLWALAAETILNLVSQCCFSYSVHHQSSCQSVFLSSQGVNVGVWASHRQKSCTSGACVLQAVNSTQVWQASGFASSTHLAFHCTLSPRAGLRFWEIPMPEHRELVLGASNVNFAKTFISSTCILLLYGWLVAVLKGVWWSSEGYDSMWLN